MTTELSPPKGHGLVRVAHNLRVHATRPQDWGSAVATDYWANFGDLTLVPSDSTDLDLNGWVETGTWVHLAGSAASFLDSTDVGVTGGAHIDTAGDAIRSPFIFGDYAHGLLAGQILGHFPTRLNMECYARFNADGGDDEDTGFGFVEAGAATPFVKAGLMALITSDGTNFSLESGAAAAALQPSPTKVLGQQLPGRREIPGRHRRHRAGRRRRFVEPHRPAAVWPAQPRRAW